MINKGFSLIEIIIASALFLIVVGALGGAILYSQSTSTLSGERSRAMLLAEEGIEATRSIRDGDFANLTDGLHGLVVFSGAWTFSGTEDVNDVFTRQVEIGTIDATTKRVTSTVTWEQSAQRPGSVVVVTELSSWMLSVSDSEPPGQITDLATSAATSNSIDLDWTAPGDDDVTGTATTYDVRYSTSLITAGNWGSATQASGEPSPSVAGSSESMTVVGLDPSTTYYFAIKTSDEVPNESILSNVPSLSTTGGITTCAEYCQSQAYSTGTCRANTTQCTNNGETYESAGDPYCPGGGGSDTCCCAP